MFINLVCMPDNREMDLLLLLHCMFAAQSFVPKTMAGPRTPH